MTVTPKADTDKVVVNFTNEQSQAQSIVAVKNGATWAIQGNKPAEVTINPQTGVITLGENALKDGSEVRATASDIAGNNSPVAKANAGNDDAPVTAKTATPTNVQVVQAIDNSAVADRNPEKIIVTGNAEAGADVVVKDAAGKVIGRGKAGNNGDFRIEANQSSENGATDLQTGQTVKVEATKQGKAVSDQATSNAIPAVRDGQADHTERTNPPAPAIAAKDDGSVEVTLPNNAAEGDTVSIRYFAEGTGAPGAMTLKKQGNFWIADGGLPNGATNVAGKVTLSEGLIADRTAVTASTQDIAHNTSAQVSATAKAIPLQEPNLLGKEDNTVKLPGDGSVDVIVPEVAKVGDKVVVTYRPTGANADQTVTLTKEASGKWASSDTQVLPHVEANNAERKVTIAEDKLQDNSRVTAVTQRGSENSTTDTVTAGKDNVTIIDKYLDKQNSFADRKVDGNIADERGDGLGWSAAARRIIDQARGDGDKVVERESRADDGSPVGHIEFTGNVDNVIVANGSISDPYRRDNHAPFALNTGRGDDIIVLRDGIGTGTGLGLGSTVNQALKKRNQISMGDGDDMLVVGANFVGSGDKSIVTDTEHNTIAVINGNKAGNNQTALKTDMLGSTQSGGQIRAATIDMGAGNDIIVMKGFKNGNFDAVYTADINLGDGDDQFVIQRNSTVNESSFDAGAVIHGNAGNDNIEIGRVKNGAQVHGDEGNDRINVYAVESDAKIYGGSGDDTINVSDYMKGANSRIDAGDGNNAITLGSHFEAGTITAGNGNDTVTVNGLLWGSVALGDGNNTFRSYADMKSSSRITSGSGNDNIYNNKILAGGTIETGAGEDTVYLREINSGRVSTGDGNDSVTVTRLHSGAEVYLGAGNDTFTFTAENRSDAKAYGTIRGGVGEDTLVLTTPAGNPYSRWPDSHGNTSAFKGFEKVKLAQGTAFTFNYGDLHDGGSENRVTKLVIEKLDGGGDGERKVDIGKYNSTTDYVGKDKAWWNWDSSWGNSHREYWTQGHDVREDGKIYKTFTLRDATVWIEDGITMI